MIFYDYAQSEEARLYQTDKVSSRTGREFTYTYYIELTKKYRDRTLLDADYYDFEVCQFKFDQNRK
jgi:hypothetical protein